MRVKVHCRTVARKFSIGGLCSSAGGLCVCLGGLDIIKLTKTPLIYSASPFNLEGLGALFGGAKTTKPPPWRWDWRIFGSKNISA